jgi:hypothetical protein
MPLPNYHDCPDNAKGERCPFCDVILKVIGDATEDTTELLACPICIYESGGCNFPPIPDDRADGARSEET